jgi:hypothetical protein
VNMNGGTPHERELIQRALDAWNAHSGTMGVVFEAAAAGTAADLTFSYTEDSSSSGSNGCAREDPWGGNIFWGIELRNRLLFMGDDEYAAVLMHEMGHFLGLSHTTAPTVMRPGQDCSSAAGNTTVTESDAQTVVWCSSYFCNQPLPTPTPPEEGGEGACASHYRLNPIYNSEGDVIGVEMEYVGCL